LLYGSHIILSYSWSTGR